MFGSSKIPQFARSLGQARKEFESGWKEGIVAPATATTTVAATVAPAPAAHVDPIVLAAENEGIDTRGKSREQVAEELSRKLNHVAS